MTSLFISSTMSYLLSGYFIVWETPEQNLYTYSWYTARQDENKIKEKMKSLGIEKLVTETK